MIIRGWIAFCFLARVRFGRFFILLRPRLLDFLRCSRLIFISLRLCVFTICFVLAMLLANQVFFFDWYFLLIFWWVVRSYLIIEPNKEKLYLVFGGCWFNQGSFMIFYCFICFIFIGLSIRLIIWGVFIVKRWCDFVILSFWLGNLVSFEALNWEVYPLRIELKQWFYPGIFRSKVLWLLVVFRVKWYSTLLFYDILSSHIWIFDAIQTF